MAELVGDFGGGGGGGFMAERVGSRVGCGDGFGGGGSWDGPRRSLVSGPDAHAMRGVRHSRDVDGVRVPAGEVEGGFQRLVEQGRAGPVPDVPGPARPRRPARPRHQR